MKKVLCVLLTLTMALSLAACGGKPAGETTAQTETTAPASFEGTMEELVNGIIDQRPVEFTGGSMVIDLTDTSEDGQWMVKSFTGLEIQQKSADMAQRSVAMNHLEDRISIVQGDIREAVSIFGAASFDVAVSNPPYMIGHHGLTNPDPAVAIARHEILCSFRDIVEQTSRVLTDRGRFYLIHRPFRLAEILCILKEYRLEPKRMRLVYPFVDKEPNMVLVEACKNGNPRIQVEKPLIVYERPGVYTREIREIYGDGR